ncbi:TPA: SdpI family protein, partial [Enterococcus faecium]
MILLILSLVLLVVSNLMKNNPPTKINSFYGFRTKKSMKNEKSWHLAQKLLGDFSKKKVIPVFLMGIVFFSIEIYSLAILKNENFFVSVLMGESLILILILCL